MKAKIPMNPKGKGRETMGEVVSACPHRPSANAEAIRTEDKIKRVPREKKNIFENSNST
jgi:hypothetical protein